MMRSAKSNCAISRRYATYPITPKLKLALNIDNLFDRVYWERAGTATRSNYYGLPRSAMLTLRASF